MSGGLFKTAPKEVLDYFDRRPSVPTFDWRDIAAHEHALAYTVAKTAGYNVLEDLRGAVRDAIANRQSFDAFKAAIEPTLQAKGWWGRKVATDPVSGHDSIVQLGSPRRLRTIYWANMASAEAAGEWERTQRTKDVLPFLLYVSSVAERKRPEHLSWVGTLLPVDDPWWRTHYPPNAWNCKCRVRQISDHEAERKGGPTKAPPVALQPWRNTRTGQIEQVPAGIDPGWQHNPGLVRERTVSRQLASALDRMPESARREAIGQLRRHPLFDVVQKNELGFDHARRLDPGQAAKGRVRVAVASLTDDIAAALGAETRTVLFSVADAAKQQAKRGASVMPADYDLVQSVVDAPDLIAETGSKLALYKTIDGKVWVAILKTDATGRDAFLNSFRRARARELDQARVKMQEDE